MEKETGARKRLWPIFNMGQGSTTEPKPAKIQKIQKIKVTSLLSNNNNESTSKNNYNDNNDLNNKKREKKGPDLNPGKTFNQIFSSHKPGVTVPGDASE